MDKTLRYRVIIAERAQKMLGSHVRFLANVSPAAAHKFKAVLLESLRSLEYMPQRFSFLDAEYIPPNKYHRMQVEKRYLILYQIKDQTVFVEYIVDCRQDFGWLLK